MSYQSMPSNALHQIDLKLLLSLQVLIEEANVTRAAERLHITQPAMSKTLRRLRTLFNDPLFTRSAQGLVPTPRLQQLSIQLPALLHQLSELVNEEGFRPEHCDTRFRITAGEMLSTFLVSPLVQRLVHSAPQVQILESHLSSSYLEDLASGKLDFAVHLAANCPDNFYATPLASFKASCLMRADHPLSQQEHISREDDLAYPHNKVYFSRMTQNGIGFIDQLLAEQGKQRRILLETTQINTALDALCHTDCLMVGSPLQAQLTTTAHPLCSRDFPASINFPELQFALIQHERTLNSAPHQWLRQQITELAAANPLLGSSAAPRAATLNE
jgi:DNA-binding transcriptional LysR family regulator